MWTVLILLAPVAFAGVIVIVGVTGLVRNAWTSWRLRGLSRFATAQGKGVQRGRTSLPDAAAGHAFAGLVSVSSKVRVVEGERRGRRFAVVAVVLPVADVTMNMGAIDLTGLGGRASFVAVAVERAQDAPRGAALLRRRLASWHVAAGPESLVAWREGTADEHALDAALGALADGAGPGAG